MDTAPITVPALYHIPFPKSMKQLLLLPWLAAVAAWIALGLTTAVAAPPPSTGGPDAFGYKYIDSRAVGGPQYNFVDISTTGTLSTVSDQDDGFEGVDMGFAFTFYDREYSSCFIVGNGYLRFGGGSTVYYPTVIPSTSPPDNVIGGFWNDLNASVGGDVFYKTIGSAPNRVFIVQYHNVKSHNNRDESVRFQIQLFESSNAIEVHYAELGATIPYMGVGIENIDGTKGLEYLRAAVENRPGQDLPPTPFTLRFERPMQVTVESQYTKPDNTTATIGALPTMNPAPTPVGTPLKVAYRSVQRFEAPEFIYLTRTFGVATNLSPTAPDADLAVYRLRNLGYAIDGEAVQGVDLFFERTITRDIKVIWRWELEYGVFVESKDNLGANVAAGIGDPLPAVGVEYRAKNSQFSASIARTVGQDPFGLDISGFRYAASTYQLAIGGGALGTAVPVATTGNRVVTENVTMTNWLRVRWTMIVQVRYRFAAIGTDSSQPGQSFVRVYSKTNSSVLETGTVENPNPKFGSAAANEAWIELGRKVEVGSFYHTADRCYTLNDFLAAPSGDLAAMGTDVSVLTDVTLDGNLLTVNPPTPSRTARVWTVDSVTKPSEVNFIYQPTVFRAEIPLGHSLDSAFPVLVPPLCVGGVLSDAGPDLATITRVGAAPPGIPLGNAALRWDQVDKKLYPVQPGSYRVNWRDQTVPTRSFIIEVVSGYPGSTADLATEKDNPTEPYGRRIVPVTFQTALQAIYQYAPDSDFPAQFLPSTETPTLANDAHYNHLFDPSAGRRPPTKLDISSTDEWAFKGLTYTDSGTFASTPAGAEGAPFSAAGAGRTVVLFSQRPSPDEIATGDLTKEKLVVRVIRSSPVTPILPDNQKFVLGRRGLELGGGSADNQGAFGVIQTGGASTVDPGTNFVMDFWMNAKGLSLDGSPVTVMTTGGGKLTVVLDPATLTITANYLGMPVSHPFSTAGAAWRHYVVHVFTSRFFGIDLTIVDFYVDNVRAERGMVTAFLQTGTASSTVGATLGANSLRFGLGANPNDGLQLDQFRLFGNLEAGTNSYLTPSDLRRLRTQRSLLLRSIAPQLRFSLEDAPANGLFPNNGLMANVGLGPVVADATGVFAGTWARLDIQEVATRLDSTLDNAGFGGSGYILNSLSNYNANLYTRGAEIGTWGPIFPVNDKQLYTDTAKRLEVAYYENPFLQTPADHPNVAWPYAVAAYDEVKYPAFGPHKNKAIYIASRIGSEGVDQKGRPQTVFDLARYADFQIYNQPATTLPGYNPNEEHAIAAPANRVGVKVKNLGEDIPNNPPLAAFALQVDANNKPGYTSDAWVLVQVRNLATGEPEMAAYRVFMTRAGTLAFPNPSDSVVNATTGLSYTSAANPEDRFLQLDASKAFNFNYKFDYPIAAGDLLIPPYPLNLVIGNVTMQDARGNNLQIDGVNQRTLWRDVNKNAWCVSGNGKFFHQFFYPFRSDFYLSGNPAAGTPVAWLPDTGTAFTGTGSSLHPVKVVYSSFWRSGYPKLKRGETLTYQGGEYFNENPGSTGLPKLVAMSAAEIVYDSATPSMIFGPTIANRYEMSAASARIIRPLDRRENAFTVAKMGNSGFTPAATSKVFIVAERWYFKELPGSLQKRFYFDSLEQKLVFRGRLNDKESGDPDLTVGPDPINTLEPNVLTPGEYTAVRALSTHGDWTGAIDAIYLASQNPHGVSSSGASTGTPVYLSGVKTVPSNFSADLKVFWDSNATGPVTSPVSPEPSVVPLDSFGVGSALVPNPSLLTRSPTGSLYVTIVENNRTELNGAPVSLHIVEIIPDRFRGAIKVIEGADAFSEKITLQHNGDFGGNTGDLYYEWWIRDAAALDVVADEVLANGTLKQTDSTGATLWQEYIPKDRALLTGNDAKHLGSHTIVFEGRPDIVLADKLVLMRYRHKNETAGWKLVPFEFTNPPAEWRLGSSTVTAPFQWAGAANSPQLGADGSKRYIPQLVMGWVKRVLDRINPYEARYADFFSNESPATYSSQVQIAGGPFAGKVALNPDKNVIEKTGLIELYETVLARARELSIDNSSNPVSTDGINQALLLAATRLSVLYELLAREAYSDAQDSTITASDGTLAGAASYTHAFQNMEADLMHEELALLRGTDSRKSYPVYNRMFWNYTKGLGEAAYNVNYNIYDANTDGFINEDDARILYPQGHGDSWGHATSAVNMHYTLLQHPGFNWRTRSELYSLMQNVLEVDFLDEKTFARLASSKARAGRDIVRGTYRLNYTQDPDGQWQGYTDGADPARAWGVSEWAHRAGQGAYFDWAVANALLPEDAGAATPVNSPENLDRIERSGAVDDIGAIAGGLHEIQTAMDEANGGVNPLGFDSDALTFDIDQQFYDNSSGGDRRSHFEQVLIRAKESAGAALATLEFATQSENKLRALSDDTDGLVQEAMRQDLDFRNRLIEIFGRPYTGTIGFGKAYPEGYEGPDTLLFSYLDKLTLSQIVPTSSREQNAAGGTITFDEMQVYLTGTLSNGKRSGGLSNQTGDEALFKLYKDVWGADTAASKRNEAFTALVGDSVYFLEDQVNTISLPFNATAKYGFQALPDWGQRTSYGKLQTSLHDMLSAEVELDTAVADYIGFLQDYQNKIKRLDSELALFQEKTKNHNHIRDTRAGLAAELIVVNTVLSVAEAASEAAMLAANGIKDGLPIVNGFSNDFTSIGRGIASVAVTVARFIYNNAGVIKELNASIVEATKEAVEFAVEQDNAEIDKVGEIEGILEELENLSGGDQPKRNAIAMAAQTLEGHRQAYFTAQAEGFRLLREREAFNKMLASKVQKNRYQDMIFRLSRNEAMSKYQSAFNNAARYTWLAARAYDYETSLDEGHPAAPGALLDRIIRERQLGLWADGEPRSGQGGLAEILSQLGGNFAVLKSPLGILNPQPETEKISLRSELFRIGPGVADDGDAASDARWKDAISARIVPDLNQMPEFIRHCRPFADPAAGPQPGIVIRFPTVIESGKNFFGLQLMAGDHAYSAANFATKIQSFGVWLENYNAAGLSTSPRAYLLPVGNDYLRTSTSALPVTRAFNVVEQRIPIPFVINDSNLTNPGYIPTLNGVDGNFGELRRHGDFRMYHDNGDPEPDDSETISSNRLVARSVWNSEWLLIIPGSSLRALDPADRDSGLKAFADHVQDIKLYFLTYSHQGQ